MAVQSTALPRKAARSQRSFQAKHGLLSQPPCLHRHRAAQRPCRRPCDANQPCPADRPSYPRGNARTTAPNLAAATMASAAQSPMPSASLMLSSAPPCGDRSGREGGGRGWTGDRALPARLVHASSALAAGQALLLGDALNPYRITHNEPEVVAAPGREGRDGQERSERAGRAPAGFAAEAPGAQLPATSCLPRRLTQTGSLPPRQRLPPATAWRLRLRGSIAPTPRVASVAGGAAVQVPGAAQLLLPPIQMSRDATAACLRSRRCALAGRQDHWATLSQACRACRACPLCTATSQHSRGV